jgi:ubiquinone/menaquinone biosynthesis C-methylase UbiE
MIDIKSEYYEQSSFWKSNHYTTAAVVERISEAVSSIPIDTKTILDIGCGNGVFLNRLADEFPDRFDKIVGLDPCNEALKYVKTDKVKQNINDLPFEPNSFDLVSCLEVLEHLPQQDFKKGLSEIQRVSSKYILVSVPNDEVLEQFLVLCPKCCCAFNPYFHMRSFNIENLHSLFVDFQAIAVREIGPASLFYSYKRLMFFLRLCYGSCSPPALSICPQCGYQNKTMPSDDKSIQIKPAFNFAKLLPFFKLFIKRKKKKRWILALYLRADKYKDPITNRYQNR